MSSSKDLWSRELLRNSGFHLGDPALSLTIWTSPSYISNSFCIKISSFHFAILLFINCQGSSYEPMFRVNQHIGITAKYLEKNYFRYKRELSMATCKLDSKKILQILENRSHRVRTSSFQLAFTLSKLIFRFSMSLMASIWLSISSC